MLKHVVISTEQRKDVGFRRKSIVFLICLIFSSVFWLITNLSTEYETVIDIKAVYKGFPKGMALTQLPQSHFFIKVKTTGFHLLKSRVYGESVDLNIDLEKLHVDINRKGICFIKTQQILDQYLNNFQSGFSTLEISPDTVFFKLSEIRNKSVPIILDARIQLNPSFLYTRSPEYSPKNVIVSGPANIIDTIKFVKTDFFELKDLKQNVNKRISLHYNPTIQSLIKYQFSSVNVNFQVEKATEGYMDVPVKLINAPLGFILNSIPSKIRVFYKVSLPYYDKVRPEMFILAIDYNHLDVEKNSAFVNVISQPPFVQLTRVSPQEIDYFIRKK